MQMISSAYIKLVPGSKQQIMTLEEVKKLLNSYQTNSSKTGKQLDWNYEDYAFPYEIKEGSDSSNPYLYLLSNKDRYNLIIFAVAQEVIQGTDPAQIQSYIQISLTDLSTYGDKTKANEYCKFFAKQLQGELHLFNKRIMYFYPKK